MVKGPFFFVRVDVEDDDVVPHAIKTNDNRKPTVKSAYNCLRMSIPFSVSQYYGHT